MRAGERPAGVGIDHIAYRLPPATQTLAELHSSGLLKSSPELLSGFGFDLVHVAGEERHVDLAIGAARTLLCEAAIDPSAIDLVLFASGLSSSSMMGCEPAGAGAFIEVRDVMDLFRYPASYLQHELGLDRAAVAGVDQQGCASLLSAIRLARAMIVAEEGIDTVLCVGADRLPAGASREQIYNVISDGAGAALVRRNTPRNRILAARQITKGALWEPGSIEHEIIAAYFPTARTLILETLEQAGLTIDDIAWILPHNVSLRSWEILLGLLGAPREKLFDRNIARVGHTIAADNIINLRDATDAGLVKPGDRIMLFTFGYGLNWSCMILEH
ncbi:MAG TPA: 3-oxoacyl-[acyl-carrier-protein] synthase III C-terminal domain-containing protein [Gemmatimonadaceae bacterium]|nr:3-oxoacyl-[acyl-carrier-protein] synthase III C-terminal domain-containing protein [Gemmatimonadaceae bacterium]